MKIVKDSKPNIKSLLSNSILTGNKNTPSPKGRSLNSAVPPKLLLKKKPLKEGKEIAKNKKPFNPLGPND